jgi:hypothetical protein
LYDRVKAYIPSFYRVTNMSATPAGPGITTVTMTGNLDTYQQYADLMLALLRMPKVQSVTRAGYVQDAMVVPPLTEQDQVGRPRKPGDPPIPDNWEERLQYFQSNAKTTGYQGVSNFGSGEPGLRGPMPGESQVTVTMTIAEDLQTPDPLATLKSGNTGGAPAPGGQVNRNANPQLSGGER